MENPVTKLISDTELKIKQQKIEYSEYIDSLKETVSTYNENTSSEDLGVVINLVTELQRLSCSIETLQETINQLKQTNNK